MSKFNDFMLQWGVDKFLHFMAGAAGFAITHSWIVLGVLAFVGFAFVVFLRVCCFLVLAFAVLALCVFVLLLHDSICFALDTCPLDAANDADSD